MFPKKATLRTINTVDRDKQPQILPHPQGSRRKPRGSRIEAETEENAGLTMVTVDNDAPNEPKRPKKQSELVMERFLMALAPKKIDGLKAEFKEIQSFQAPDTTATAFAANKDKNRYHNILCFDKTRVPLTFKVPPETDYIHANWVDSSLATLTNKYICTQGPTETTVNDFWRLIWQEKVRHVVMLCGVVENGKPKCAQYYPLAVDEPKNYGAVTVTNKRNLTAPNEKIFEATMFEVVADNQEPFGLTLYRWLDWPDFSIPQSGMGMLRILKAIRDQPNTTALIHCSAGVGRTGTLMACEICLRIMLEGKELSVPDVVKELRTQRAGLIQTESQYIYLHRALCEYLHAKKCAKKAELAEFFTAFCNYRQGLMKPAVPTSPQQPALHQPAPASIGAALPK